MGKSGLEGEEFQLSLMDHDWFCIKFHIILFMQVKEILSTKCQLQPKISNSNVVIYMSGNIVTQTFMPSHKMVV